MVQGDKAETEKSGKRGGGVLVPFTLCREGVFGVE
jgi:hypothetical protein